MRRILIGTIFLFFVSPATFMWGNLSAGDLNTRPAYDRNSDASRTGASSADAGNDFCATQRFFEARHRRTDDTLGYCYEYGRCDQSTLRDLYIPSDETRFRLVRLYFHIFREDTGLNPACTEEELAAQVERLNADYYGARFQFEYQWRWVNDSRYRSLYYEEDYYMKEAYHVSPDSFLNVWVTYVEGGYSYATFPFDTAWALSSQGGIVMTTGHMDVPQSTLGHEIGHCFGLFHTFNGVDEEEFCGPCYEPAGTTRGDSVGDRCRDTDPTPTNTRCAPPGGVDPCSGNPWGSTHYENIMSYGSHVSCARQLSEQQKGRMMCWFLDKLRSWEVGVKIGAANTFGPAPLAVTFEGQSTKEVNQWHWDFGDGGTGSSQSPVHEYQAGLYDVGLNIMATDGPWEARTNSLVWAYADTLYGRDSIIQQNRPLRVDVSLRNFLPLIEVTMPFSWSGSFNLQFDSANTTGLRTAYANTKRLVSLNPTARTGVYQIMVNSATQALLAPGNGPILSLWFRVPATIGGRQMQISFPTVGTTAPKLRAPVGEYAPILDPITLYRCVPGDVDGDLRGPDGSDLQWLVDYLFFDDTPPPFPPSANVDGLGAIDGSDLQYLVDHIFFNGPAPQDCRYPM